MEENKYGWICPKCGCPNAPTNATCVACFSETVKVDPFPPTRCSKCGIDLSKPLGFCCPDYMCPQRSGLTPFNPLNAIDNIRPYSTSNVREEGDDA